MSNRTYLALTSIVAAAGGLIVVTSFAFSQSAATWIALGLSVIALAGAVVSLAVAPSTGASRYRAVAGVIAVIAAFTIITSVGVFSGGAQHWIEFGAGVAALGLASLAGARYVSRLVESTGAESASEMPEPLRAAA
jgi:cell division protein FtsW (lipid II flippase)